MGICRVRLRWRNEWWSQVSAQNRKKHVLPPRLQGIEAEVKYGKKHTFVFSHLEVKTVCYDNSTSSFCPLGLDLDIFYSYL